MSFKEDLLKNEKMDPHEASSLTFINVPLVLLALFLGFGVTYLALRTENTDFSPGDSRTKVSQTSSEAGESAALAVNSLLEKGKQVYVTSCQVCHQASGAGLAGVFPPLGNSEWVTGPEKRLVAILLYGLQGEIHVNGQKYQGVMPPFKDTLSSEELAAVATYIRNSFENQSGPVPTDLVEQVREETQSRSSAWQGENELNSAEWESK